jgi:hypothetical protein
MGISETDPGNLPGRLAYHALLADALLDNIPSSSSLKLQSKRGQAI